MVVKEHTLYKQIAQYLQLQYPNTIYRFDLAADMKLTTGQASRHKTLHPHRGYPDLFLAEPRTITIRKNKYHYAGLFIELKREGTRILKKDGTLVADAHIREQHDLLCELERRGYKACFAVGFDQAKQIIDDYLGKRHEEVEF